MSRTADDQDDADRRARIEALFGEYRDRLTGFLRRRMRTTDDAADLVQETFTRFARVDSVTSIAHPRAFLFQTAINLLRDDARKRQVRTAQAATLEFFSDDEVLSPERVLEGKQRLQRFERALAELSPRSRDIFLLARYEGFTHVQIAERIGISVSAVEKHMMRAILHLDAAMEE